MMRLNKFLAQAGVASRRKADEMIKEGQFKVNGEVVRELGRQIDEQQDEVSWRGRIIKVQSRRVYIALNKPVGIVSSATNRQGQSVVDLVDTEERLYPVGRLDKDSSGLIILTNDGDFALAVSHPNHHLDKEYIVYLDQPPTKRDLEKLNGMEIDGKKLAPVSVVEHRARVVRLILRQGINRQIRRQFGQLGYGVMRLERVRIGRLKLGRLAPGQWRHIKPEEVI